MRITLLILTGLSGCWFAPVDLRAEAGERSAVSQKITEALRASLPQYSPPKPAQGTVIIDSGPAGPSDPGVVRLPDYVLTNKKTPALSDYEMLTPKGKIDQGLKLHPGLRVGPFAKLNHGIALRMIEEERQKQKRAHFDGLVDLAGLNNPAEAKALRKLLHEAYLGR